MLPMRRFKAVFFDVGGTILRMGEPEIVYRDILAEHGYQVDLQTVKRAVTEARQVARAVEAGPLPDLTIIAEREVQRRDMMVCEILRGLGVSEGFEECRQAIWDSWLGARVFHQYPEAESVLARLKQQGYIVGAISNWESRLEALCGNHGLRDYFDFILASEAEGHVKPSPFLFKKALHLAGVRPDEALHVGDNYREDVLAAQAVGISAVLLARDGAPPADHSPTVPTLAELLPLAEASAWIRGQVTGGAAQAADFTQIPWVHQRLSERLGFAPHPGTLNLQLSSESDRLAFDALKAGPGLRIVPEPGFCAARCYPVVLEGKLPGAALVPEVPGYPRDSLELLAPMHLRDTLGLNDGSTLTLAVPSDGQ
jgi:HAD superfamily hydrolase (TIGR01549 family)